MYVQYRARRNRHAAYLASLPRQVRVVHAGETKEEPSSAQFLLLLLTDIVTLRGTAGITSNYKLHLGREHETLKEIRVCLARENRHEGKLCARRQIIVVGIICCHSP